MIPKYFKIFTKGFATIPSNKIRIISSESTNIHFNLATEEYLYEHSPIQYPTLFLWRNDRNIVIGRHQNPWKECFIQQMNKDNVLLSRRRSGGGAVYQDLGNSCFSFFYPVPKEVLPLNVKDDNNEILISALKRFGVEAEVSGRNDICVNSKKISGSAYQVGLGKSDGSGRKVLHHGTMLIDVSFDEVQKYLNPNKEKLKSKGVDSVKSRIENLVNLNSNINHSTLSDAIAEEFKNYYKGSAVIQEKLDMDELKQNSKIDSIYKELTSWEWLYQKTPEFTNNLETRFDWGIIDIFVQVQDNLIKDGKVYSDSLYPDFIDSLNDSLTSGKYHYEEKGITQLCQDLRVQHSQNETYLGYINDVEKWFKGAL